MKLFITISLVLLLIHPGSVCAGNNIWDTIKAKSIEIGEKSLDLLSKSDEEKAIQKIDKIKDHASDFTDLTYKKNNAPRSALFGKTKDDYQVDITEILDKVEATLFDGEIIDYSENINLQRTRIKNIKNEIASLKEKRVLAAANNNESKVKEIDEEIVKLDENEKVIELNILEIEDKIGDKFRLLGVSMTREQIETLITRIDGDDLIKSITMYEVLKQILATTQELMTANMNNMEYVKKYYGVYVLLSETVVYAQTKYIEKNKNEWAVNLQVLKTQAHNVIAKTKNAMKEITDSRRKSVLENNIKSNLFTIEVIGLYNQQLLRQREKVEMARVESLKDVKVAWSSYETATVSSDLIDTIDQAEKAFESVIQMEIPEIVVFDNEAVKQKYAGLTAMLKSK